MCMTELKHAVKHRNKLLFDKDRVKFFKKICSKIGERYWFEFDAIGTGGHFWNDDRYT